MNARDERKESVIRQFSRNAHKYVTNESHRNGDDLKLMVEWTTPQADWTVLDVATGGGHVAKTLAPHVRHVMAADLTREMLSAAAGHLRESGIGNVTFVVADAEALPFLDEWFDLVTCRIAAHHFPRPDKFVREVSRVLRPGGLFLLIDNVSPDDEKLARFHNTFEAMRDESHVRCASLSEWRAWMTAEGLHEERSRLRKKTYRFREWVERTTRSVEQAEQVEQYILSADEETRRHFAVTVESGRVVSLEVDEWMVLTRKRVS